MSMNEQQMQPQGQPQQFAPPPAQTYFSGTEMMRILEISKGKSLDDIRLNPLFYSHGPLLPMANLSKRDRMLMIWSILSEIGYMKRLGVSNPDTEIKYIENLMAGVGQTSRAVGGAERELLSTSRQVYIAPQQRQPTQERGVLGSIFAKISGRG